MMQSKQYPDKDKSYWSYGPVRILRSERARGLLNLQPDQLRSIGWFQSLTVRHS